MHMMLQGEPTLDSTKQVHCTAQVPTCYMMNPPRLQPGHFAKFQLETLMYVFYSMPGDEAQVFAADELAVRGWWFHKEFKARVTLHLRCWRVSAACYGAAVTVLS